MDIKIIVFDLGNVLIPFDYSRVITSLNNTESGLGDRFYKRYKTEYNVHREYEKWALTNEEFLKIMMQWTENKITEEQFCHIYADLFSTNDDVIALLPELKKNYKLVLLSNTNFIHQKYGWEKYEFLKYFDKLVLSHEAGAYKPEEKIYRTVEKFTGEPSSAHLFIDDVKEYCDGAEKLGWKSINFINYNDLVLKLRALDIVI